MSLTHAKAWVCVCSSVDSFLFLVLATGTMERAVSPLRSTQCASVPFPVVNLPNPKRLRQPHIGQRHKESKACVHFSCRPRWGIPTPPSCWSCSRAPPHPRTCARSGSRGFLHHFVSVCVTLSPCVARFGFSVVQPCRESSHFALTKNRVYRTVSLALSWYSQSGATFPFPHLQKTTCFIGFFDFLANRRR